MLRKAAKEAKRGHGLGSTKWNGCFLISDNLCIKIVVNGWLPLYVTVTVMHAKQHGHGHASGTVRDRDRAASHASRSRNNFTKQHKGGRSTQLTNCHSCMVW